MYLIAFCLYYDYISLDLAFLYVLNLRSFFLKSATDLKHKIIFPSLLNQI